MPKTTFPPAHPRSRGEHLVDAVYQHTQIGSSPLARGTPLQYGPSGTASRLIPARAGNTEKSTAPTETTAAHPRSRGEHAGKVVAQARQTGSSPLARGTPVQGTLRVNQNRLIPARAGNTSKSKPKASEHSAHPRSRGEHCLLALRSMLVSGSSPLARGTQGVTCCTHN